MSRPIRSEAPTYLSEGSKSTPDDAPPPYAEISAPAPPGQAAQIPSIKRQFPPAFNVYLSSNILSQRKFVLGQHQNEPFYSVTTHTGFSGNPDVVLHTGISSDSPPLATAEFKTFSADIICTFPPVANNSNLPSDIRMKSGSWPSRSWSFSVEVTNGTSPMRPEPFEWRHSSSEEVKSLAGWGSGFKLVHTASGGPGRGTGPRSGDGNEVVAFFAEPAMSVTKKMQFRFVGSGETGVLGERWSVMAVVSALGVWEKERRRRNQ